MTSGHYTTEDFKKCEILREKGYKIDVFKFTHERHYIFHVPPILCRPYKAEIRSYPETIERLIAYKKDYAGEITQEFAEKHLMDDVFDKVVEGTEDE